MTYRKSLDLEAERPGSNPTLLVVFDLWQVTLHLGVPISTTLKREF